MTTLDRLRDKANSLPLTPGVYIMKDKDGTVIYVGKAKRLKNRVTTYFTGNEHTRKTECLVGHIFDFDYILCDTEMEALTLENVLIKKHTPKYNIRLKDAKSYPYIKITAEAYPKIVVTRERKGDRARYFGPYSGVAQAYGAAQTVQKILKLPTCKRTFPADIGKDRPCIYKDMGLCIAPCTGHVSVAEYGERIKEAAVIFDGDAKSTAEMLEKEMNAAAEDLNFERAAELRDSIRALGKLSEKQKVVADVKINRDVFALYLGDTGNVLGMLSIRGGALVRKNELFLSVGSMENPEDAVGLIADYYERAGQIPRQVMLDFLPEESDLDLLSDYLSLLAGVNVEVRVPERGAGRAQCDLAYENAKEAARQKRLEGEREDRDLKRLCELIGLSEMPRRIEAYDISNVGNEAITASMVVFGDGKFKRGDYRTFRIKTTEGADDYASMREALDRRLSHIGDGTPSLGEEPDLILLDGGETHVRTVARLMRERDVSIPLFGMVKDDYHKTRALTDGEREISIALEMNVYALIYKIQEEAHRFAYNASQTAKKNTMTHSTLEKIPGIGPAKAKKLLAALPLSKIRVASEEELRAVRGIGEEDARAIVTYYKEKAGKKRK